MTMIKVNEPVLEAAPDDITRIAAAIDEKLQDLRGRLQKLQWEAADRDAYNALQRQWDQSVEDMRLVLPQIATALRDALANYRATTQANVNRFS